MRRAFTITELLVVLLVFAILAAALMPVTARLRSTNGQVVSAANLQMLAFAHALYALDFDDRQVSTIPDDYSLGGGTPQGYFGAAGCIPPTLLGFDHNDALWGYLLPCHPFPGSWANIAVHLPMSFGAATPVGAHRLINARMFNTYLTGRFYSPLFYAPNDTLTYGLASVAFDAQWEFVFGAPHGPTSPLTGQGILVNSSYSMSPAAMWNPQVLSENAQTGLWWTDPNALPLGHQSPTVSQCVHPDLKTRMIEHNWNLGQPGAVNPSFAGGVTPYFYSHGIDAAPLTLFFDGHVAELHNAQVAADDAKVLQATGGAVGLWTRDTPLGAEGYYGAQSFDGFMTGHHAVTASGIHGRDVLYAGPPPASGSRGGVAFRERPLRLRSDRADALRNASPSDRVGDGLVLSSIPSP